MHAWAQWARCLALSVVVFVVTPAAAQLPPPAPAAPPETGAAPAMGSTAPPGGEWKFSWSGKRVRMQK